MSFIVGKLHRKGKLSGSMSSQPPELQATVTQVDISPRAAISRDGEYSGKWLKAGSCFSGVPKPLDILYRFVSTKLRILTGHKTKAIAVPAIPVEAERGVSADLAVKPSAHETVCPVTDQKTRFSVSVKLSAYRRAALVFIRNIRMKSIARVIAADGKIAKYIKAMKLNCKSKAVAADSAIMESRFNKVKNSVDATAITANAACTESKKVVQSQRTIKAEAANAIAINGNRAFASTFTAALYAWYLPEYADGALHIFQCVSGIQSSDTVEIDMETESAYWANAFVRDGVANLLFAQTEPHTSGELELI